MGTSATFLPPPDSWAWVPVASSWECPARTSMSLQEPVRGFPNGFLVSPFTRHVGPLGKLQPPVSLCTPAALLSPPECLQTLVGEVKLWDLSLSPPARQWRLGQARPRICLRPARWR